MRTYVTDARAAFIRAYGSRANEFDSAVLDGYASLVLLAVGCDEEDAHVMWCVAKNRTFPGNRYIVPFADLRPEIADRYIPVVEAIHAAKVALRNAPSGIVGP